MKQDPICFPLFCMQKWEVERERERERDGDGGKRRGKRKERRKNQDDEPRRIEEEITRLLFPLLVAVAVTVTVASK